MGKIVGGKQRKDLPTLDAHLKELQELSKRLRVQISSVQKALRKSFQSLIKSQISLQKELAPVLVQLEGWKNHGKAFQIPQLEITDISRIVMQFTDCQSSIQKLISPVFEYWQETFHELTPRTQKALMLLGEYGWYLDFEMPISYLWQLEDAFSNSNVKEAENSLIKYFENRLADIEKSIIKKFPHRGHLIESAFNAHRKQEYVLSIPVFLAQTDGICKEVFNQYLFMKKNRKPRTAIYIEQIVASYTAALLSPLAKTLPISESENERSKNCNILNRHSVLHGESLNYGIKINSLKAISLINYVAHVLQKVDG